MEKQKALFLPFMQIPTGHHHVADALIGEIQSWHKDIVCDKVDILSYSYGSLEKMVSATYLNWIKFFPDVYDWLYKRAAYKQTSLHNRRYLYEVMFIHFLKRLTKQHDARILFCTHALPSNMASALKVKNKLQSVTVNVYTDFFVNGVWGIDGIDYHLVPTLMVKEYLVSRGVRPEQIYVTGIPIDNAFRSEKRNKSMNGDTLKVLVTGGSLGAGSLKNLLPTLSSGKIHYIVLCGQNETLYRALRRNRREMITPIPYIDNKADMNRLYDQVDAVLTKPGGVTVSECLMKRKPIFLYHPLPGQERINAEQLEQMGAAIPVDMDEHVEAQLLHFLTDETKRKMYKENVEAYHRHLDQRSLPAIIANMLKKKH